MLYGVRAVDLSNPTSPRVGRVVDVPDSKVQYFAFGFNKDNKELQQEVNAAIAKLKKDGTLNELHEKWFNTPAPDMPSTAEEALGIK